MTQASPNEVLQIIDTQYPYLVEQIGDGSRILWLGSAISFGTGAPGLSDLLKEGIELLQNKINSEPVPDPYREALNEVFNGCDLNGINLRENISTWNTTERERVLKWLWDRYSRFLEIHVPEGELGKGLMQIVSKYADTALEPDAEHFFIGMLVEEGCCQYMITTNWESMIEVGHEKIRPDTSPKITPMASNQDLVNSTTYPRKIFKIHGCARKATENPEYIDFVIGTESEIAEWADGKGDFSPIKNEIIQKLTSSRSLFIGLSGQDFNLKSIFYGGANIAPPEHNPPRLITTSKIEGHQKTLLKSVYGRNYYNANRDEINQYARIPLYAKPLLGGLYLAVLRHKLRLIVESGELTSSNVLALDLANDAIRKLINKVNELYDDRSPDQSWVKIQKAILKYLANFLNLYRDRVLTDLSKYRNVHPGSLSTFTADQNLSASNFDAALSILGLLFEGENRGKWTLSLPTLQVNQVSQLDIDFSGQRVRLFILDLEIKKSKLEINNIIDKDKVEHLAIIFGRGYPSRSHKDSPIAVEIWLEDLIQNGNLDDAVDAMSNELKPATVAK